jgi:hypothetical protein
MIEIFVCGKVNYDPNHWPATERYEIDAEEDENVNIGQAWLARQNNW